MGKERKSKGESKKKKKKGDEGKSEDADEKNPLKGNLKDNSKDGKAKKQRRVSFSDDPFPFDPEHRDECVQDVLDCMFEGLEEHVRDLAVYPKALAFAVSKTVAHMVQMVCHSNVKFMRTWTDIEGRAHDEWLPPPELNLPPIDTWARAVIPLKLSAVPMTFPKSVKSEEGQFHFSPVDGIYHAPKLPPPRLSRRASESLLLKHMRDGKDWTRLDKKLNRRRVTDSPCEIEKRRKKMLEGIKKRLSAYVRDQAILNKILEERGLVPRPRSEAGADQQQGAYFETYK